jgi:glycosyltransferase involved in cell wall biosynthesis
MAHLLVDVVPGWLRRRTAVRRQRERRRGHEDFEYPATWNLLRRLPWKPDILHLHNLHGGYFDLRALPWLTNQFPAVLTLHDMWLLTGHCAYSMGCERWRTGCGQCPDLTLYPAIERDATAYNWERKRRIFARSRMHVVGTSQWVLDLAMDSMLQPAVLSSRVIHDGVDVGLFSPGDRRAAREAVGVPADAHVLVFVASSFLKSRFKDWATIRGAAELLGRREWARPVVLAAIGDSGPTERVGTAEMRCVGKVSDQSRLVQWYRAADICVHAARADNLPGVVLEALASGVPVVATAVGGIPEQVRSLTDRYTQCPVYDPDQATGILVPPAAPEAMADAAAMLLLDDGLRWRLGENAVRDARERFSNERMVKEYLQLYEEVLAGGACQGDRST